METPVAVIPAPAAPREESTMRRFLAERGVIVMKETRPLASIAPLYGAPLVVGGQILFASEFPGALNFVSTSAAQMGHDHRDYSEVTYSTRDDVMFGFYQDGRKQQAFVRLGAGSPLIFFPIQTFPSIHDAVVRAHEHVDLRRAAWESTST